MPRHHPRALLPRRPHLPRLQRLQRLPLLLVLLLLPLILPGCSATATCAQGGVTADSRPAGLPIAAGSRVALVSIDSPAGRGGGLVDPLPDVEGIARRAVAEVLARGGVDLVDRTRHGHRVTFDVEHLNAVGGAGHVRLETARLLHAHDGARPIGVAEDHVVGVRILGWTTRTVRDRRGDGVEDAQLDLLFALLQTDGAPLHSRRVSVNVRMSLRDPDAPRAVPGA